MTQNEKRYYDEKLEYQKYYNEAQDKVEKLEEELKKITPISPTIIEVSKLSPIYFNSKSELQEELLQSSISKGYILYK